LTRGFETGDDTNITLTIIAASDINIKQAFQMLCFGQPSPAEVSEWLQSAARLIESGRGLLSGIIDKVAKVVAFPFLTLFAVLFSISVAILLLGFVMIV
jgi:hypothetical protein